MNRQQRRQAEHMFANDPRFQQPGRMPDASVILSELMKNPQIANNPRVKEVMRLRESGDTKGLEKLGTNICSQNGVSYETAAGQFRQMMQGYGYNF